MYVFLQKKTSVHRAPSFESQMPSNPRGILAQITSNFHGLNGKQKRVLRDLSMALIDNKKDAKKDSILRRRTKKIINLLNKNDADERKILEKRPPSAFFLFSKQNREDVKEKLEREMRRSPTPQEISSRLGKLWKALRDDEKNDYKDEAAENMAEYKKRRATAEALLAFSNGKTQKGGGSSRRQKRKR